MMRPEWERGPRVIKKRASGDEKRGEKMAWDDERASDDGKRRPLMMKEKGLGWEERDPEPQMTRKEGPG